MQDFETIGSALDNKKSAIHNWYRFTAGFSYKFVDTVITDYRDKIECIYDPFAGCGTTLVEAQKKSIPSKGNESQKFMADIINAKLNWDIKRSVCKEILNDIGIFIESNENNLKIENEYNELLTSLFDDETLRVLYLIRDYLSSIDNVKYQLFFKLALSQVLHKAAIHPISVPYISRSKYQIDSGHAWRKFLKISNKMLDDIDTLPHHQRCAYVYNVDSREANSKIENGECDLCITSPPYLNNLDYGEVSKVHTHFFGLTKNWNDITVKIRHNLVTGATTHYKDSDFYLDEFLAGEFAENNDKLMPLLVEKYKLIQSIAKERKGRKSFHILMMLYFEDMYKVFKEMFRVLAKGGEAYLILGDSAPYGTYIPTTQLLGEISQSVGFGDYSIYKLRNRGEKWKALSNRHNIALSENILKIRK